MNKIECEYVTKTTVTKIVQYSLLTMEDTLQHPVAYPGNCVERKHFSFLF